MDVRPTIAAVVCARNEEVHIERCLRDFIRAGIDVVLIDQESDDNTRSLAESFLGRGLLAIERLPWRGRFALEEQLTLKRDIIANIRHDWIVHADADEWLHPPAGFLSLGEAIARVDAAGFNCINFNEFVFLPLGGEDFTKGEYTKNMTTYYFFEPWRPRLMRVWKRELHVNNITSGGHILNDIQGLSIFPEDFILRHYIMLSHAHGIRKYVPRRFDENEIARGWHINRLGIRADDLLVRGSPHLKRLSHWNARNFDVSSPSRTHFWQWT